MREPIDAQLARRRNRIRPRRRLPGLGASLFLHVAVTLMLVVVPRLFARPPERLDYVSVQLMPLQALGTPQARPAAEERRPEPEPEPEPAEPEPEPVPEPPPPRIPEPEPPPPAQPPPTPQPEPQRPAPREPAPQQPPAQPAPQPSAPAQRSPSGEAEAEGTPGRPGSPEGDPRGTSPLGTTLAGLDNPDFTYGYYLDRMLALIDDGWRPPVTGERLETVVHFRIQRDGTLRDVSVVKPSGDNAFDLAGLRAVQSASPLPPLPAGYHHDTLGVNLILH